MDDNQKVLVLILKIVSIFIIPLLFMVIWNEIMPVLCGFNTITYWQSFFLGIAIRLINGSVGIKLRMD